MTWNYNMDEAPKGKVELRYREGRNGKDIKYDAFVPEPIIACSKDGKTVTISRWIPPTEKAAGRWNMFATDETPLAWMPWPEHPGLQT